MEAQEGQDVAGRETCRVVTDLSVEKHLEGECPPIPPLYGSLVTTNVSEGGTERGGEASSRRKSAGLSSRDLGLRSEWR